MQISVVFSYIDLCFTYCQTIIRYLVICLMERRYVDLKVYKSSSILNDGNVDYKYWFDKSNEERLHASGVMTSVAFKEPDFFNKKVDRTVFTSRKHSI